jgi:ribonucleotide reductase beta subunit family protein with ferritin-like domain
LFKTHQALYWTTEEIDLIHDKKDWESRTVEERRFISMILAFFATADGIVGENLICRLYQDIPFIEAKFFYGFQIMIENVHAETYSLLIETYITDHQERDMLFHGIENFPSLKTKAEWAHRYIHDPKVTVLERLVAFACVEGIFFSGSFCAIFWLKKRGLMPGLAFSNELISRDEGLHCEFAVEVYKQLIREKIHPSLTIETIENIISSSVKVEEQFIEEALCVELIGMNSKLMIQYIRFVADRLYSQLYEGATMYHVTNPFEWMDMITLQGKTNFFERRVSEYSQSSFQSPAEKMFDWNQAICVDASF